MKHYLMLYGFTFLLMTILDGLWIGVVANDFYKSRIADLEFHALPAVLFYLIYVVGIVVFVSGSPDVTWQNTLLYGAFFGFVAYATYDMTNLATLRGWSSLLAVVDLAWGTFVTAIGATSGLLMARWLEKM